MKSKTLSFTFTIVVMLGISIGAAFGQVAPARQRTPNMDKRPTASVQLMAQRQAAAAGLTARVPRVSVDYDPVTTAPTWVSSAAGFLSGPESNEPFIRTSLAAFARESSQIHCHLGTR
jgi:hypothetical protein